MFINDLEVVRMRHNELLHEAEEARLAAELKANERQQKKTENNRPVFHLSQNTDKLNTATKTAELKRVPNTH